MPALAPSVTDVQFYTALRAYLLQVTGAAQEVIRAQTNRAAPPVGPAWISMTSDQRKRLSKARDDWDYSDPNASTWIITQPTEVRVQIDLYGPSAGNTATVLHATFNDSYACDFFAAQDFDIQPLYSTEAVQLPLINGEAQYEQRYTMTLALQINPAVSTPQDFADTLAVGLINVDVVYPPEP
jgi:hypothetical protein